MLRTNLSTHPFYNVRAVQIVLGTLTAIIVGVSAFNAIEITRLSLAQRTLGARAASAEAEAARLRQNAAAVRAQINPRELNTVAAAAREANGIIDRRAFSWTQLFTQFEETLPADVRIVSVQPSLGKGGTFAVSIAVQARREEDLDAFIEALEQKSTFTNVLPKQEEKGEDGLIEADVQAIYTPPGTGDVTPAGGVR